jgi:hypothetical protein
MNKEKMTKPRFKKNESGYHKSAVHILAEWVGGTIEEPFYIDSVIAFVPDVTCRENGVITCLYEVVHKHFIDGRKLDMMQMWSYFNYQSLTVYEVSADFILKQTEKPNFIDTMECHIIDSAEVPVLF